MTDPIAISHDLVTVARDWLVGNRPAAIPGTVAVRAAGDTASVERPYLVLLAEGVRVQHGILVSGELVLRMRTQADEQTAAAAAGWHMAAVRALRGEDGRAGVVAGMQARGYWLRDLFPGDYEDAKDGRRGRRFEQRWRFHVQTELP